MTDPRRPPFGPDYVRAYFTEVDRMDPDGLLAWYAEGGRFRFANQDRAEGKAAIRALLTGFYQLIRSMRHEPLGLWTDADSGVMEAAAHFTTADGRDLVLPAVSVLRVRDGLVHDFRFVMDASPLQGGAPSLEQAA